MNLLAIQPLVGVGQIRLGASRADVHALLGKGASFSKTPASRHPTDAWFSNCLQIHYGNDVPTVECIEVSSGSPFEVQLFGCPVFSIKARELVAILQERAELDEKDPELGCNFVFPSLELSLWRPVDEEPEGLFFSTVSIGIQGYYSR